MSLHDALSHVESAIDALRDGLSMAASDATALDWIDRLERVHVEIEAAMDLPNDETPPENA